MAALENRAEKTGDLSDENQRLLSFAESELRYYRGLLGNLVETTGATSALVEVVGDLTKADEGLVAGGERVLLNTDALADAIASLVSADDDLVDVEVSLLEVQQTRLTIQRSITEATAAHNEAEREQAEAVGESENAYSGLEGAMGVAALTLREYNRLARDGAAANDALAAAAERAQLRLANNAVFQPTARGIDLDNLQPAD